jgi:hypothetical protein
VSLESPGSLAYRLLNVSETRENPPTITASWQFDTRAACYPRAPSSAS